MFRGLFRYAPIGLFVADTEGRILLANAAARALSGFDRPRRGVPLSRFIAPEHGAMVESYFQMACGGAPVDFEASLIGTDGAPIPVSVTFYPLLRAGRLFAIGGRFTDDRTARLDEQWLIEMEQRSRSLFDYNPDAVVLIDPGANVVMMNRAVSEVSDYALEDLALRPLDGIFAPEERAALQTKIAHTIHGATTEFESAIVTRGGMRREALVKTVPVYVEGKVAGAYVIVKDISAQQAAERAAREQSDRIRSLYLVAASAGRTTAEQLEATLDLGRRLLGANVAILAEREGSEFVQRYVSGSSQSAAVGARRRLSESYMRHALSQREVLAIEDLNVEPWLSDAARRAGLWSALIATPIDVFGKPYGMVCFATEEPGGRRYREADKDLVRLVGALCGSALERVAHEERLGALAFHDALTGLPNRVLFDDRAKQTYVAARRHSQKFAILYVDLDHFKEVNDTFGHAAGDELLRTVAARLNAVARESDTVARQGGDEFVVLQRFVRSALDTERLARRINESLRQPIDIPDGVATISASIGVAVYPDDGATIDDLLVRADAALYKAKEQGRDRTVLYVDLPK